MSLVWDASKAEGGALLLMLAIADHCHDDGTGAWPAIASLAQKTRQSDRHVQRLLLQLEASGELKIIKGGGRSNTNEYHIILKGDILSVKRVTSCPQRVTSDPVKGDIAMSPDPSGTVSEPSLNRRRESAEHPSLPEVLATAEMIGLSEWKARDWFDEMEGCGWLDFQHRPVVRWQSILNRVKVKWEADGRPDSPPARKQSASSGRTMTPLDLRTIIAAKETRCTALKAKHCAEGPLSSDWNNDKGRTEFYSLKREIKTLNNQLSQMA